MKKYVLAPALAALAMFVFGAVYWMSPFPYKALSRVPDDAAAGAALAKIFPATGAYFVPGMYLADKQHEELLKRGPTAEVHFIDHGMPLMDPMQLVQGYIHEFVVCLVLVMLLEWAAPGFKRWICRAKFCAMIGLLQALCDYGYSVWWYHSIAWETSQAVYDFLALVVVGLVLGKLLTPKPAPAPAI
jgi:hypothetical protein